MAAGEKQKLEILKLLYLDQRFLILDEPTSVLTPGEADEMLGLLRDMAHRGEITVAMISHKFREVEAFCDDFTVLRRGARVGGGKVGAVSTREMAAMMIGDAVVRPSAARASATHERRRDARDRRPVRRERRGPRRGQRLRHQGPPRRDRRHRRRLGQRPERARRGPVRTAPDQARAGPDPRRELRADARPLRPLQGVRPAGGAAEERLRADHVGRREHGVPHLRQGADVAPRLLAVARADARARRAS